MQIRSESDYKIPALDIHLRYSDVGIPGRSPNLKPYDKADFQHFFTLYAKTVHKPMNMVKLSILNATPAIMMLIPVCCMSEPPFAASTIAPPLV